MIRDLFTPLVALAALALFRPVVAQPPPASMPAAPMLVRFPAAKRPIPASAPAGATEAIHRACLAWFDSADAVVPQLAAIAEKAATKLMAGGTLYVAGTGGFADEFDFRAGSLTFIKIYNGEILAANDVLMVGDFRANEFSHRLTRIDALAQGHGRINKGSMVIYLGSLRWPTVSRALKIARTDFSRGHLHVIDTGAPAGGGMQQLCVGQLSATALAWALHGEILAAATRRGKTFATWASDWEPDGRRWDASVRGHRFHPKYKAAPVPAGRIGREYLRTCRAFCADFLATQPGQVRLAGKRLTACMKRGGVVWAVFSGHVHDRGAVVPRELTRMKLFGRGYDWRRVGRRLPAGDMVLWMGYLRYPRGQVRSARERKCDVVVVSVDKGPTDEHVTSIRGCWKDYDTVISLAGYPIRVLPASGVVQTPQWYSLMAETLAGMQGVHE